MRQTVLKYLLILGLTLTSCAEAEKKGAFVEPDLFIAQTELVNPWIVNLAASTIEIEALEKRKPIKGAFKRFNIQVDMDLDNPANGRIEALIDLSSIDAGSADRDQVLKSPEMFYVRKHPAARFTSNNIMPLGNGQFEARGELSLKATSKEIVLPFSVRQNVDSVVAVANVELSRLDFNVGTGSFLTDKYVGYPVTVRIEVSARKADE